MRRLAAGIVALILLAGCAASLEELEREAMQTGDWSAVEARNRVLERREAKRAQTCPAGKKRWCTVESGHERCSCIVDSVFNDRLRTPPPERF